MDETYFVFYTDNGVHFGQHRFGHGKLQPYEEDVNFPLIVRGPGIPHGVKSGELVGNHDIAPTLAGMGGASFPPSWTGAASSRSPRTRPPSWPRTAILSERETNDERPTSGTCCAWGARSTPATRTEQKEYYDLARTPTSCTTPSATSDTTYPPPDSATRDYYEQRLDALYACAEQSCRTAENAPLLPTGIVP